MHLLMSVFITDKRWGCADRGLLPTPSRADVLRYTLESFAVLPIQKAYLYIELDDNYRNYDLSYVYDLFDVKLRTTRITNQKGWQAAVDELSPMT